MKEDDEAAGRCDDNKERKQRSAITGDNVATMFVLHGEWARAFFARRNAAKCKMHALPCLMTDQERFALARCTLVRYSLCTRRKSESRPYRAKGRLVWLLVHLSPHLWKYFASRSIHLPRALFVSDHICAVIPYVTAHDHLRHCLLSTLLKESRNEETFQSAIFPHFHDR